MQLGVVILVIVLYYKDINRILKKILARIKK